MKIVVAPDSYKGSLTAMEVADAIEKGIKKVDVDIEVIKIPMADGGEGTVRALIDATGGKLVETSVSDPLLRNIKAFYGILGDKRTAVIEMAAASGLPLLKDEEKDPLKTTTYGTGELILNAIDMGCENIIIGIGGSATNDGGQGMAKALGIKFIDMNGNDIGFGGGCLDKLYQIDMSGIDKRIYNCRIVAACDVDNPLCGVNGASYVFGSQKGASPDEIKLLDENLRHYGEIIEKTLNTKVINYKGAGAAGGLGGGLLTFLNAKLKRGIDIVIETTGLERTVKDADLVITGEGMIDFQTAFGKTPYGVAQVALKYNIPVIAISGGIGEGADTLYGKGFSSIFSIVDKPMSLEESIRNSDILIERAAERIMRTIKIDLK